MVDVNGAISTTSGIPYQGWDPWTSVSGGSSRPGAPVTAVRRGQGSGLFIADEAGGIRETSSSAPPATPENLHVTSVTAHTIAVSWTELTPASVELDGFLVSITRMTATGQETAVSVHGSADRTASYTGLNSGVEHNIRVQAFNANGYSPNSTPVVATTTTSTVPPPPPSLFAHVTNGTDPVNYGNSILLIEGSNFGKGEQVLLTVEWTVGTDPTVAFPLGPDTTDAVGAFTTSFTGNVPEGLCPISEPFGVPQPTKSFTL